jgi:hypothetical protein
MERVVLTPDVYKDGIKCEITLHCAVSEPFSDNEIEFLSDTVSDFLRLQWKSEKRMLRAGIDPELLNWWPVRIVTIHSPHDALIPTQPVMRVVAGWENDIPSDCRCRYFIAWRTISALELAGVVAGYESSGNYVLEEFYAKLDGDKLKSLWLDYKDRVKGKQLNQSLFIKKTDKVCTPALSCLFEWNDRSRWDKTENLYLAKSRHCELQKPSEENDLLCLNTGRYRPWMTRLCREANLSCYPVAL